MLFVLFACSIVILIQTILIYLQLLGNFAALLHQQPGVQGLRTAAVIGSITEASLNWRTGGEYKILQGCGVVFDALQL